MIYSTSNDNKARYLLGCGGTNTLVVVGVNPSSATDTKFDPTIRKIIGFANKHGFDGWVTLNVYPQRATDPADLNATESQILHKKNLSEIKRLLKSFGNKRIVVWAAWGDVIDTRPYLKNCLRELSKVFNPHHPHWVTIGARTKKGHPRHPSRMAYNEKMHPFSISDYLV